MSRHIKPQHCHEINIDVVGGHPFHFSLLFNACVDEDRQLEEQKAPARAGMLHTSLLSATLRSPTQTSSPTDLFLHVLIGMMRSIPQKEGKEVSPTAKMAENYT